MNLVILDCILEVLKNLGLSDAAIVRCRNTPNDLPVILEDELNIGLIKYHELINLASKWYDSGDQAIYDFKL